MQVCALPTLPCTLPRTDDAGTHSCVCMHMCLHALRSRECRASQLLPCAVASPLRRHLKFVAIERTHAIARLKLRATYVATRFNGFLDLEPAAEPMQPDVQAASVQAQWPRRHCTLHNSVFDVVKHIRGLAATLPAATVTATVTVTVTRATARAAQIGRAHV